MGLFGSGKSREEKAMDIADQIASGKGFYGRLTKATLGSEDFARVQESIGAMHTGMNVQQLLAMGVPTTPAKAISVSDTGQLVNYDPVVDLTVEFGNGAQISLRTIISKLAIPRRGDGVLLVADPQSPGNWLYAGLAA